VSSPRPKRLKSFDYLGCHRYFVTCCVAGRRRLFVSDSLVNVLRSQILQSASLKDFAILAYTFMPDHLHMRAGIVERALDYPYSSSVETDLD